MNQGPGLKTLEQLKCILYTLQHIETARDDWELENLARAACGTMKSIAGMCIAPLVGEESKLFVQNSYSVGETPGQYMLLDSSILFYFFFSPPPLLLSFGLRG
jgi:hypothetical protein